MQIPARSALISRIRGKDTKPEILVRSLLHRMGFRFRLHCRDLPGSPDIVLPRHAALVFVHGCFWHRHARCKGATTPRSRIKFWQDKFATNVERDKRNRRDLRRLGWNVLVVWECELKKPEKLGARQRKFLDA